MTATYSVVQGVQDQGRCGDEAGSRLTPVVSSGGLWGQRRKVKNEHEAGRVRA